VEKDGEQGHEDDTTTEAGKRTEKSRDEGDDRNDGGEGQNGHLNFS
jgi:hypothetical protein